jgi:trigger factor
MHATAEVLDDSKVKLSVELDEDEVATAVESTLRRLTREARVPGFRPGKVPRQLLEARMGKTGIRSEALREALPDFYLKAVTETETDAISAPEIDIVAGEESGPVTFAAVVQVRPKVLIAGYPGLRVTIPSPEVTEEDLAAQIDRLRSQFGVLEEVDRSARAGDHVTVDVTGSSNGSPLEALSTDDLVYEVGSGGLPSEADAALVGAKVGDVFAVTTSEVTGEPTELRVLVKQVREKILPSLSDEWASEASEFETLEELRADLEAQLRRVKRTTSAMALREGALDALAELVVEDLPQVLVSEAMEEALQRFGRRLAEQRVPIEQYLAATGQSREEFVADLERQARQSVRLDLALRALADAEGIVADDEEVAAEIERLAEQSGVGVAVLARQLEQTGRLGELRSELRSAKAAQWLLEHVEVVDSEGGPVDQAGLLNQLGISSSKEPSVDDLAGDEVAVGTNAGEPAGFSDPADVDEER